MTSPDARPHRPGCIVTGAAGGIGQAIAHRLAADGYAVLCVDRDAAGVRRACAKIGDSAQPAVVDLADREQRREIVPDAVERLGRVDLLVNNAAYHGPRVGFLELPLPEWDRVLETNLTAAADLARSTTEHLVAAGRAGTIVNIAAIQEVLPVATYTAYGVSKGGVSALTRSLAVELAPYDIRVNAVAPGVIHTDAFQSTLEASDEEAGLADAPVAALLGRGGRPEEIAGVVSFLASGDASYLTGVVLPVDGGRSISRRPDPFQTGFRAQEAADRGTVS